MTFSRTKLIDDQKREIPKYKGLIHGTISIVREEGIGGIYRGLFPVVSSRLSRFSYKRAHESKRE